jgi:Rhabdovirus nucleocapsid protein
MTDAAVLGQWMYVGGVANDFERLMKDDEEVDQEYSYMPYLSDMGLSKRSPYSCTINAELHTWANMVCALNGLVRAINARRIGEKTSTT